MTHSPADTRLPEKSNIAEVDMLTGPLLFRGVPERLARQWEHWKMYHSDTRPISPAEHSPLSATSALDLQEGSSLIFLSQAALTAGPMSSPFQEPFLILWSEANAAISMQRGPKEDIGAASRLEESDAAAFIKEESDSVVLWRPVTDRRSRRKARAMAEAIKKRLANVQQATVEDIMAELRGRPW